MRVYIVVRLWSTLELLKSRCLKTGIAELPFIDILLVHRSKLLKKLVASPFKHNATYLMYIENLIVKFCGLVSCSFVSASSSRYLQPRLHLTRLQCRLLFFTGSLSLLFVNCSHSNNTRPVKNTRIAHSIQVKEMLEVSRQMVKWSPSKTK